MSKVLEDESVSVVTDDALLSEWCEGDVAAGQELIERYFKPLSLYFRSKLSTEEDVQELVQVTLVACAEQRERLREVASFRAYLFGIARNKLLSFYGRSRTSRRWDDIGSVPLADLSPGPSTLVKMQQRVDVLLLAMDQLSIDQQTALQLKYWAGMTQQEVADALGVPLGTAARRIHTATRTLAKHYASLIEEHREPRERAPSEEALAKMLGAVARRLL